jgi:hypothetical protein
MPLRFYKNGNDVKINDLDSPGVFVGSVLKENGELKFYPIPGREDWSNSWINEEDGYRMTDIMTIAAIVMEMPEHFWIAIGEFEDCDRARNKGISKTRLIKQG